MKLRGRREDGWLSTELPLKDSQNECSTSQDILFLSVGESFKNIQSYISHNATIGFTPKAEHNEQESS